MKKVKTIAAQAEDTLSEFIGDENRINKRFMLEGLMIDPVQIDGTVDDALLMLFENTYVRTGFNVDEQTATIPNLFCKFVGEVGALYEDLKAYRASKGSETAIYTSYRAMSAPPRKRLLNKRPQWYVKAEGVDVEAALSAQLGPMNVLQPNYRKAYFNAVNEVLRFVKSDAYKGEKPLDREVLEVLLFNSNKIIKMFHTYDFQANPPKFVVYESKINDLNGYAVLRLLMMNALGFDIILLSPKGFASIENYISKDAFSRFRLTQEELKYSKTFEHHQCRNRKIRHAIAIIAVILGIMLVCSVFASFGFLW